MWRSLMVSVPLLLLGACASPSEPQISSKALKELAQQAKAEGKDSISTGFGEVDMMWPASLPEFLRKTSIAIGVPAGTPRVLVDGDWIMTAQDVRVERWVRRGAADPRACKRLWPGVTNDDQLMTIYLSKGTVAVDGVNITNRSQSKVDLANGQRYLFFVQDCRARRLEPTYWSDSFLAVTEQGAIALPAFNERPISFLREIVDLRSITALEASVRNIS